MTNTDTAPAAPRRGRPRSIAKAPVRDAVRPTVRSAAKTGRVEAIGRDGKVLSRKRSSSADIFHIPPEAIPHGWSYEWKRVEVAGKPDTAHQVAMAENGWTPVAAGRHPGLFMPPGYTGHIIRDGLMLMERPQVLTDEARIEEQHKARQLLRDQQQQLGLTKNTAYAEVKPRIRTNYEPAPDAPRPQLQIDPS